MKLFKIVLCIFVAIHMNSIGQTIVRPAPVKIEKSEKNLQSQWKGKRVAFLGDSMTDKRRVGTTCIYWEYLTELLGIEPIVYGMNGNMWDGIYKQAVKMKSEKKDSIDAVIIFAGTNDFNHNTPIGKFYNETIQSTNYNGQIVERKYRTAIENDSTFCGRINKVMQFLKANYPQQQIIILTPIHRGFAKFSDKNVQPEENYANAHGLYIDNYVDILKASAANWSVPCIDLYQISGLYPLAKSQGLYFANDSTDRLHPNSMGDYRLAKTLMYQLLSLPSTFVLTQDK